MSFFAELKRRNVIRVGIAYVVVAWVIAQVAEFAFENFGAPDWVLKSVVVMLILGMPIVLIFAWAYELTPEGIKREADVDRSASITVQTGRKLDRTIIVVLAVMIIRGKADLKESIALGAIAGGAIGNGIDRALTVYAESADYLALVASGKIQVRLRNIVKLEEVQLRNPSSDMPAYGVVTRFASADPMTERMRGLLMHARYHCSSGSDRHRSAWRPPATAPRSACRI